MRFWIGVASREHVRAGVRGGFAQFNHGKRAPAARPAKGDGIVYYSSKETRGRPDPRQRFVAIGRVLDDEPTQVIQAPGFEPWRRRVAYREATEVEIQPLIKRLSFIKNKSSWGAAFRFGFLEIGRDDFETIARTMLARARLRRFTKAQRDGARPSSFLGDDLYASS
jgi:hypothetical protein